MSQVQQFHNLRFQIQHCNNSNSQYEILELVPIIYVAKFYHSSETP